MCLTKLYHIETHYPLYPCTLGRAVTVRSVFLYGAVRGLEPLWQLVLGALSGTRLLHYCINLAVLGGNDPHSYGVTSRRASMNTLRPEFTI